MQSIKILICDDQEMAVRDLIHALRANKYDVVFTDDADSVLKRAREERFDLIMLDMDLGPRTELDGEKLLKELRQQEPTVDIPIIGITGVWQVPKEVALKMGFLQFYSKPFEPVEIIKDLGQILKDRLTVQDGMKRWLKRGEVQTNIELSVDLKKTNIQSSLYNEEVSSEMKQNELLLGHQLIGNFSRDKKLETFYKIFSSSLYENLFRAQINVVFQQHRLISRLARTPYRMQLRLSDPSIADLPWELCRYSDVGGSDGLYWLGGDRHGTCVRIASRSGRLRSDENLEVPLKILVVGASPESLTPLDLTGEFQLIHEAFKQLDVEWRVLGPRELAGIENVVWTGESTPDNVRTQIDEFKPTILHFMTHGSTKGSGTVYLEDNDQPLPWTDLLIAMKVTESSIRLLIFNCCLSASSANGIGGLAKLASDAGVAAVVGHLYPVTDDAAKRFAKRLYTGLAKGDSIDLVVQNARRQAWEESLFSGFACLPILYITGSYIRINSRSPNSL
jgi:CheY-like chemotaxis protein